MPSTPVEWLPDGAPVNGHTNGTQNDPTITQLANGNVLVCWVDYDDGGPGFETGPDIIARVLDPLGNAVMPDFRINPFGQSGTKLNPEIVALANGGFMVVYENSGTGNDIQYQVYTAGVAFPVSSGFLIDDAAGGAIPNNPVVASTGMGSAMTAYVVTNADGSDDVYVRAYAPSTDTFLAPVLTFALGGTDFGDNIGGISLSTLSNNNYVLAIGDRNSGADGVAVRFMGADGVTFASADFTVAGEATGVHAAGLRFGNVAVTWSNDAGAIFARVLTNSGSIIRTTFQVNGTLGIVDDPAIAALADGGFVIVWSDDNTGQILGRRINASGTPVGIEFIIDNGGGQTGLDAVGLGDGRFQVTWSAGPQPDIRTAIFDARDTVNAPVYTPIPWRVGTVGDDVFADATGQGFVHGWSGNDVITEFSFGTAQYFGDDGNDTIIVTGPIGDGRLHDGGSGSDTIDWRAVSSAGNIFDLQAGVARNGVNFEVMAGFESLLGTNQADTITGTADANGLFALGGDDFVYGGGGNDALAGGAGNDEMSGGTGNDTLLMDDYSNPAATNGADVGFGDAGDDLLWGYGGNDILFGGAGNDNIVGNDYASNVAGTDQLFGGVGNDILFVGLGGSAVMDGGAGNDTFFGGALGDTLRGGTGNDYLYGNTGGDIFQFYQADFVNGDVDIVYFVDLVDRLRFSASLNGDLTLTNTSLEYSPGLFVNSVYITVALGGGQTSAIAVYGATVASLTPLIEYTL
jgi:hypothetical protein